MEELIRNATNLYHYAVVDMGDPRTADWLLMSRPHETIFLTLAYYASVFFGIRWMKDRKAFDLQKFVVLYNAAMVYLSAYMFYEFVISAYNASYSFVCTPVDYSNDENAIRMAKVVWWYYFSKCIEFLDTFFMILRKKNEQITFLHVYHHGSMFLIWWMGVKWAAGGQSWFGATINCGVHVIMYLYYMLAALKINVWWKKYITILQLTQFFFALGHSAVSLHVNCNFPTWMQYSLIGYLFTLIILFANFYRQSYSAKSSHVSKPISSKNITANENSVPAKKGVKSSKKID